MVVKDRSTGVVVNRKMNLDDGRGKGLSISYEEERKTECDEDDDDSNNKSENEPKKPKRTRSAFTTHQLDQLELCFSMCAYPDAFTRGDISRRLNIKKDRIQMWFQNRRARHRKEERTGNVSIRSRARQQRVQRLKESQVLSSMYRYSPAGNALCTNRMMSPQTPSHSMSQFSFQVMAGSAPNSLPFSTVSSPIQPSLYPFSVSETFLSHPPVSAAPSNGNVVINGHHSTLTSANHVDN